MSGPERSPGLSLTLVDATTMRDGVLLATSDVLIAARRPGANRTHPNVVSVPTQRIPASLHADLLSAASHEETTDRGVSFFDGGEVDSGFDDGHHPVVFAVESLLGRKLGLAEALENGEVEYRAALRAGVRG